MGRRSVVLFVLLEFAWVCNAAAAEACANFRGQWDASVTGKLRCSALGQSESEPFAAMARVRIRQRGCSIRIVHPGINLLRRLSVRGTIDGRRIQIQRPPTPRIPNFQIDEFHFEGVGSLRGVNRASVQINTRIEGELQDIQTTCTANATARFARLRSRIH